MIRFYLLFMSLVIAPFFSAHAEKACDDLYGKALFDRYPVIVDMSRHEGQYSVEKIYKGFRQREIHFDQESLERLDLEENRVAMVFADFLNEKAVVTPCAPFFYSDTLPDNKRYISVLAEAEPHRALVEHIWSIKAYTVPVPSANRIEVKSQYEQLHYDVRMLNDPLYALEYAYYDPYGKQILGLRGEIFEFTEENIREVVKDCSMPSSKKDLFSNFMGFSAFGREVQLYKERVSQATYGVALEQLGLWEEGIANTCFAEHWHWRVGYNNLLHARHNKSEALKGKSLYFSRDLKDLDFSGLNLREIRIERSLTNPRISIENVSFKDVKTERIILRNADLRNVDLRLFALKKIRKKSHPDYGIEYRDGAFYDVTYDCQTKFPDGFDPNEYDAKLVDEKALCRN